MNFDEYFSNCSKEYLNSIDSSLYDGITEVITKLPKRQKQEEINNDLFWLLIDKGWSFDTLAGISENPPPQFKTLEITKSMARKDNKRFLCETSTTLDAQWHSDFAKLFNSSLVQIEAQFGKVESMFKDFCGFRIAKYERRLALGVEIVLCEPYKYFSHRMKAIGGMAYFDIAEKTLPAIGLNCPIWLVGIRE
ncbi:MAG: hypothetical protein ABSH06_14650 [Thermodesulfobacteriota bacterium]